MKGEAAEIMNMQPIYLLADFRFWNYDFERLAAEPLPGIGALQVKWTIV